MGVYLDGRKDYGVRYLSRDKILMVFLLGKPLLGRCGIVNAVLDLTSVVNTDESVEFKCYTNNEGGTTWKKWGHIVGLANNENGKKRYVKARLAWRVNVKEKRFETIENKVVTCDTTGYGD